ncbi:unnamed protein product, partial [Staurois parvus]
WEAVVFLYKPPAESELSILSFAESRGIGVTRGGLTTHGAPRHYHLETRSVGGPMRCPWYLFHRLF